MDKKIIVFVGGAYGSKRKNSQPFYDALVKAFPDDVILYYEKSMNTIFGGGEDELINKIVVDIGANSVLHQKDIDGVEIILIGKSYGCNIIIDVLRKFSSGHGIFKNAIDLVLIDPTNAKYPLFAQKYHGRATIEIETEPEFMKSSIIFYEDESENKRFGRALLDYRHRNVVINGVQVEQRLIAGADHFTITRLGRYFLKIIDYIRRLK